MKNKLSVLLLACTAALMGCGGGGGASSTLALPSPKLVELTSYGNKHDIVLDDPQVTALTGSDGKTVSFGDFFQEGAYSAFVAVDVGGTKEARFLKKNGSAWTDQTTSLMPNTSTRGVCSGLAQAFTADFNGDGKPDVFLACGMSSASDQQLLMSQSGSTSYARQTVIDSAGQSIQLQGWGAAAADLDGDGDIDIVLAHNNEVVALENKLQSGGYWVLRSAGHSNAWIDLTTRLDFPTLPRKVFLIPHANALPDLVVGGDGAVGNITLAWMQSLNATSAPYYRFTGNSTNSAFAPAYQMANLTSASIYDVVKVNTNLVVLAKDQNISNESSANQMVVLRYALPLQANATPGLITYSGNAVPNLISQFKLISTGQLVAYDGACVAGQTRCSFTATP
jgi:hypothetical protein